MRLPGQKPPKRAIRKGKRLVAPFEGVDVVEGFGWPHTVRNPNQKWTRAGSGVTRPNR